MSMTSPGAKEKMLDGTRAMTTYLIIDATVSSVIAGYATTLLEITGRSLMLSCLMVYVSLYKAMWDLFGSDRMAHTKKNLR